jgi:ribose 5-phosphate isomerase B
MSRSVNPRAVLGRVPLTGKAVAEMRIAIGCDHVGFPLKASLIEALEQDEHAVLDLGAHGTDPTDYPPLARAVATAIDKNFVDLGILACETGVGASIAANRFAGIRAVAYHDPAAARQGRERLDVNLLCLGAADVDSARSVAIVREWVAAKFLGQEQDVRAIAKIAELEETRHPGARRKTSAAHAPAAPAAPVAAATEAPRVSDISAVMKAVAAVKDSDTKLTATRLLQFLRNRFPSATATVVDEGFTFTLDGQHVATVTIGRNFVELEAGPEHVTTSKLRNADGLEMLLNLPSITKAFDAVAA